MLEAYKKFWIRIMDYQGTSTREEYWCPTLINALLGSLVFVILETITNHTFAVTNIYSLDQLFLVVGYQCVVVGVWLASFSVRVRRLHDIGLSGKWIMIFLIPVIGPLIFCVMALLPSKKNSRYPRLANNRPRYFKLTLMMVLFLSFLTIWGKNYVNYTRETYRASQVSRWGADQTPLISKSEFEAVFNRYYGMNNKTVLNKVTNVHQVIIPGLHGAWSLNHTTHRLDFGDDWVPQGLAENKKYYFISAYDGEHRLNSLVFLVNKVTGKYYKSIILKRKAHVGGLALDETHKILWISDDLKSHAQVEGVSLSAIKNYQAKSMKRPIASVQDAPLYWAGKTSGLAYFKNNLLIVKYGTSTKTHSVVDMEVVPQSGLVSKQSQKKVSWEKFTYNSRTLGDTSGILMKEGFFKSFTPGYERMQGLTVLPGGKSKVHVIYSQSNGSSASDLMVNEFRMNDYFDFNKIKGLPHKRLITMKIPPSAEQVSADERHKNISVLFEGGAKEYRKYKLGFLRTPFMDRLIVYHFHA